MEEIEGTADERRTTPMAGSGVGGFADEGSGSVVGGWATRVITAARSVEVVVTRLAILFGLSGLILWSAPAFPIELPGTVWSWIWRLGLICFLLIPASVTIAFASALKQLASIPPRLLDHGAEGSKHALDAAHHLVATERRWSGRLFDLLKSLYRVGRSTVDAKDTVVGGLALARLFNPAVIVLIGGSIGAGFLVTLLAAATLLLGLIW